MASEFLLPGTLLHVGTYRIVRALGQGGFGITYLAEHVNLGRQVAIKEFFLNKMCVRQGCTVSVATDSSRDEVQRYLRKFMKEARNIAHFDHPNIVKVYDVFEENGTAYFVMEYCSGGSLSALVQKKQHLAESEARGYICQLASALNHLHAQQMNHLDVKPANVMLDKQGKAVLIDFGLSKQYDEHGEQTSTTPVGISEGYAPMEQYKQGGVAQFSPETDLYALGATYYKLLTGETPPSASDVYEEGGITQELLCQYGVSEASIQLITRAMSPIRKQRLADASEFQRVLGGKLTFSLPNPDPDDRTMPVGIKIVEVDDTVRIERRINGHEYVDLGLPSGTKWATCNVGAVSSEDYGDFFAWGETSTKTNFNFSNYRFRESWLYFFDSFSKYFDTDNKTELDLEDDAARVNWGDSWRIPSVAQLDELRNPVNCTWEWTSLNGKKGHRVTSKYNGNSIFLPAAGCYIGDMLYHDGNYGYYWSRSLRANLGTNAYTLLFGSNNAFCDGSKRYNGRNVRPVLA